MLFAKVGWSAGQLPTGHKGQAYANYKLVKDALLKPREHKWLFGSASLTKVCCGIPIEAVNTLQKTTRRY